jgi:hypothetical protein
MRLSARRLLALASLASLTALSTCATTPTLRLSQADDLRAARELADDGAPGDVWLHWQHQVRVEASAGRVGPPSEVRLVAAVTRFVASEGGPVSATLCVPASAAPPRLATQLVGPAGGAPVVFPATARQAPSHPCLDPTQAAWRFDAEAPPASHVLELSATFEVQGPVDVDLQPLTAPSGRLVEGLWRFDVPDHARASLTVRGRDDAPVTTPQADRVAHGLFVRDLRPAAPNETPPHLVFSLASVSPLGATTDLATSWEAVAGPYREGLVAPSPGLSANHAPPVSLTEASPAARLVEAFAWVRGRPTRLARPEAAWSAARPLPGPLGTNELTDTDRVHALAWLLRAHGLPFTFVVARPASAAPLRASQPQPRAFTTALLAVRRADYGDEGTPPDASPWRLLDPGCADCPPGKVRPSLRGGSALLLEAPAQLIELEPSAAQAPTDAQP